METLANFIDGRRVPAKDGRTTQLVDPAIGTAFAEAPLSGPADVDLAMASAATAFAPWRDATPSERSRALLRAADALEARTQDFVEAECRNSGKPVSLTTSEELPPEIDQLRFFSG